MNENKPMTRTVSDPHQQTVSDDERELGALGYAQELFRTMGGFSNFAISFSIISILTGAVTLYGHGLTMGGPAEMAFGWPLVVAGGLKLIYDLALLRGFARVRPPEEEQAQPRPGMERMR